VIEWNDDFEVARVNDAALEILGYDAEELLGKSWEWIVPESETERVGEVVESLLSDRGGYRSVNENVRPDGERIVCEWYNRVVTDDDGDAVAVFSQFQDVTERERRATQLRRSRARLEALFENSPDMINVHDTEGNIVDPNPRLCEETGYDADELTGMKVWELDESVEADEVRAVWERMDVGDRRRFEGVYRRRDGSTFPVAIHLRRLDLEGDERFVVISRDISARKEYERDLRETKERLDTVVSNVPVVLFALDADGTFTLSEGRGLETLGLEPGEVVGESALDRYADQPDVIDAIERALDGEVVTMVQKIGERFFETAYQPVVDDGAVSEVIGIAVDITERRRREAELRRQNERLEEFVGVVSHDLQNPLNVAEGRLELAREESDSDHLDDAARALGRMDELITDLLRLAREGKRVNEIESVALADLVADCWHHVETPAADLVVGTELTLRGDPGRLRHLLTNLLRNAVEHGSADGDVTVTVGTLDDGQGFFVADDGPGIPEAKHERVFESGYSTDEDGTGFGLAIAKEVAEAHGWSIRVTEGAAGGARFEVTDVDVVE
jgi:PAS domain S-box-containing protein